MTVQAKKLQDLDLAEEETDLYAELVQRFRRQHDPERIITRGDETFGELLRAVSEVLSRATEASVR